MRKIVGTLAAMAVVCAALCGCGKKEEARPSPANPKTGTSGKVIEVGLVSPALTSVFHVTLVEGAKAKAKEFGWKLDSLAPDRETDFAEQVAMVESLIQRKVDAISICAINDKAISGAVREANKAGIPIFVHNSLTELPEGKVVAYIGYNQREGGRKCGRTAIKLLTKKYGKPKGKIAILEGIPGFHNTERKGGFVEIIDKYPDVKIVASQPANWEREKAVSVAENVLQGIPDIDLFFGCSDAMAQGASRAASQMGKKVFTIGIDGNPDALADIRDGKLTATLATRPRRMGEIVVETIKKYLDGEKVGPKVETPTEIVTKENVDKFLKK